MTFSNAVEQVSKNSVMRR